MVDAADQLTSSKSITSLCVFLLPSFQNTPLIFLSVLPSRIFQKAWLLCSLLRKSTWRHSTDGAWISEWNFMSSKLLHS